MRRLGAVIVLLGLLWALWWLAAQAVLLRGLTDQQDALRARGWDITAQVRAGTNPLQIAARMPGARAVGPAGARLAGARLAVDGARLAAPVWWPGDVTLTADGLSLTPAGVADSVSGVVSNLRARLRVRPGPALALDRIVLNGGSWRADTGVPLISGADAEMTLTENPDTPFAYDLRFDATGLTPGDILRGDALLPQRFAAFGGTGQITFDRRLDRHMGQTPPRLRAARVGPLALVWGDMALRADGAITVDAAGLPEGEITLELDRWRDILALARRAGVLDATLQGQAEILFQALANRTGGGTDLTLPLRFAGGQMYLGPILLGPAPVF